MEEQKNRMAARLFSTLAAGLMDQLVTDKEKVQRTRYQRRTYRLVNTVLNIKDVERRVSKRFFRIELDVYLLAYSVRYWARVSTGMVEEYFLANAEDQQISERRSKLESIVVDGSFLSEEIQESIPEDFREALRNAMIESLRPKFEETSSVLKQQLHAVDNYRKAIEGIWGILYPNKSLPEALERRVRQSRG